MGGLNSAHLARPAGRAAAARRTTGRRAVAARAALTAALALGAAVGCRGERAADVAYDGPFADVVREAIPKIERAAGLPFKQPPKVERRSRAEVRAFLEREFADEAAARDMAGQIAAYKLFDLLADTLDVRALLLDLLTEQIIGFYDPSTEVLYVVDEAPDELRAMTIEHELVHALQDQYVDLDSLQRLQGENDRVSAAKAVIEGEATYEQLQLHLGLGDIAAAMPGGWDRVRREIRQQSTNMPVFSAAPMVLQETILFPYLSGAEFVRALKARDSTPILRHPLPASTEQVLHVQAYAPTPDVPTRVTLPAPRTGEAFYENGFGEFETRLVLYQWLRDQNAAIRGAAGWDGDRYVLLHTPGGDGAAWLTVWDSAVDAGEFFNIVDDALARRFRDLRSESLGPQERRYTGGDRALRLTAVEVQGRPAVLLVDMPRGSRTDDVIDAGAVRLDEGAAATASAATAGGGH
ncbi:MAG TPA: hypothetical protein VFS08_06850 [Gemmatimonadaceae bacterium]|nr:hypothetical protein [Gemmatimonadaceae bacterium]